MEEVSPTRIHLENKHHLNKVFKGNYNFHQSKFRV